MLDASASHSITVPMAGRPPSSLLGPSPSPNIPLDVFQFSTAPPSPDLHRSKGQYLHRQRRPVIHSFLSLDSGSTQEVEVFPGNGTGWLVRSIPPGRF